MIKSNSILNIVLIVSLITGVFLRLYNINHDNLWIDEMATFWVTDPSISFKEMLERHSATELAPQFYYILIYFIHNIFGYSPDIGRYFSSATGMLSIFTIGYLVKMLKDNGSYKLSIFLVSLNVFLISYSFEMRTYMLLFFISSLSLIFVFKYFKTKKKYFLLLFFITQVCSTFTHPFSVIVFASIAILPFCQYILRHTYEKNFLITLVLTGISVSIIIFTYYFNLKISGDYLWNEQPTFKFFTNLYFSQYFGSRALGIIHLIILLFLIFKFRIKILKNDFLFILLILFILSYFIPLIYGLYKPILTSKYIIFVLIPIIVLISVLVNELENKILKNFLISLIILTTIGNQFTEQNFKQFFESRKYFKPQYDLALKYINESKYKNFYVDLNFAKTDNLKRNYLLMYKNYLEFMSKKNNYNEIQYVQKDQNYNSSEVWILCSYLVYGDNCKKSLANQTILEERQFQNLYLTLVKTD